MGKGAVRRVSAFLLFGICCSGLSGCGKSVKAGSIRSIDDFDDTKYLCFRAKIFVMGLDYILRTSEFERTDSAFRDLGECLSESRKTEWGKQSDNRDKLVELADQVKALLQQKPPNVEEARPIVDEMMGLSKKLPGDEPFLEGDWVNLKKL